MKKHTKRLFALHPTQSGFGWVLFEGATNLIDWGVVSLSKDYVAAGVRHARELIDDFKPDALVLESLEAPGTRWGRRAREFGRKLLAFAADTDIEVHVHGRNDVNARFVEYGASTRYQIARVVASSLKELAPELPPKRKIWLPESPRMGIFNAAAVALTHYWHEPGVA